MDRLERKVKAIVKILVPVEASITFTLIGGDGSSQLDLRAIKKFIAGKEEEKIALSFGGTEINAIGEYEIDTECSGVNFNDSIIESINNNINGEYKSEILTIVNGE